MSELQTIEQQAQVGAQLANAYLMGGLAEVANIAPGAGFATGSELQGAVADLMTDLGIEILPPESGSGWASGQLLTWNIRRAAAAAALRRSAQSAAAGLSRGPAKWAAAFGIAASGLGVALGTYSWLSEDTEVRLAEVNAAQANVAEALKGLTPEQRERVALALAEQRYVAPPSYVWPAVIALVGLGAFAIWRTTR
jgi:hypothetical protein